jgi:hypothetical protein
MSVVLRENDPYNKHTLEKGNFSVAFWLDESSNPFTGYPSIEK